MTSPLDGQEFSVPSSEELIHLFETVRDGFEQARAKSGDLVEHFYRIGGYCVRLQFAGHALAESLTLAFAHLRIDPQESFDLSVGFWDSVSTGVPLAPPSWGPEKRLPRCAVYDCGSTRIQVSYEVASRLLTVLDIGTNEGYLWIPDAAEVPPHQSRSPLLLLLHEWMALNNRTLVHGGAVGTPEGGVLIVGKAGSGKSTTMLCCLDSPLLCASDDYGLVTTEAAPYFYSLYSSGKILAPDINKHSLFPKDKYNVLLDTQEALYFLHPYFPEKISTGFPLRAIVVPRVSGQRDTRVNPTSAARAMLALAPSTLFQLPGEEVQKFGNMARLAKALPAYILESGTDWKQIPLALEELITDLNAKAAHR